MQVSTRLSYPDTTLTRPRVAFPRPWTGDTVEPVRADERGSGYRGILARGSHQPVNERSGLGRSADMEVFVARSLSSTLAMLQMHVDPEEAAPHGTSTPMSPQRTFVDDLLSGVLGPLASQ